MDHEPDYRSAHRPGHLGFSDEELLAEVRRCAHEQVTGTITIKLHARHAVHLEITRRSPAERGDSPRRSLSEADVLSALAAVRQRNGYGRVEIAFMRGCIAEIAVTQQFQRPNRATPPAPGAGR